MHNHKKELVAAVILLAIIASGFWLYLFVDPFRLSLLNIYNSFFKTAVSDRGLKEQGTIYSNLPYCQTEDPYQTLDLFLPESTNQPQPLVIFIHGGGWRTGDKSNRELSFYGETLLSSGFAIASINYRLATMYTYPFQDSDVACALNYLQANAQKYQYSATRWGLFGDSAGAQLAASALSNPKINQPFRAFVGFYGPYDLSLQVERKPYEDTDAIHYTNDSSNSRSASPYYMPPAKHARYRLYHGLKDRIVHPVQSERFANRLTQQGITATYIPVEDAGHFFSPRTKPSTNEINKQIVEFYTAELKD